jgi:hypothetical protein
MTVGFSLAYCVLTSVPIKKGQTNVSKREIPTRICAAYHDAVIGTETLLLSVDGSTWLDSNVPMQMSRLWMVTGEYVALGGVWRTDEGNKNRKA